MDVQELWQEFEALRRDDGLCLATNLAGRAKALAFVAFIKRVARTRRHQPGLLALQQQAAVLQQQLEAINATLFQTVRAGIQAGRYPSQELRRELNQYTTYTADQPGQAHFGHEGLDVLVQG